MTKSDLELREKKPEKIVHSLSIGDWLSIDMPALISFGNKKSVSVSRGSLLSVTALAWLLLGVKTVVTQI
jgi:hypothetical protein